MKYQRKSYTTTDFYESYKQYIEPNTPYDIDLQTYKISLMTIFSTLEMR